MVFFRLLYKVLFSFSQKKKHNPVIIDPKHRDKQSETSLKALVPFNQKW